MEESQVPKLENYFCKRAKWKVIFIAGKKLLPVTLGWRDQRMRVIHSRSVGSTDRAHTMVFLTKKDTDVQWIELEVMASRPINGVLEVRVGGKPTELGTLYPMTCSRPRRAVRSHSLVCSEISF